MDVRVINGPREREGQFGYLGTGGRIRRGSWSCPPRLTRRCYTGRGNPAQFVRGS